MNYVRGFCTCMTALSIFMVSCAAEKPAVRDVQRFKKPGAYNFRFVGCDVNITNPVNDRRSYYRIMIDKIEVGRTVIGLESQEKSFESMVDANRHLLMVEKWVLDEKQEKYIKVNNIDQPRPNFIYFGASVDRIVIILLKNDAMENRAAFEIEYEHE